MRVLFEKLHSFPVLRMAFIVAIACVMAFGLLQGSALDGKTGIFRMQTAFTVERLGAILQEWGEEGVAAYRRTMYADYIFPLAYGILLASGIALTSTPKEKAAAPKQTALFLFSLPLIAALCDLVENSLQLIQLQDPQTLDPTLTFFTALAASIKFTLLGISITAIAVYGFLRLRQRVQAKRASTD